MDTSDQAAAHTEQAGSPHEMSGANARAAGRSRPALLALLPAMGSAWQLEERDGWTVHRRISFDGSDRPGAPVALLRKRWWAWPVCLPVVSSPWLSWDNFDGAASHDARADGSSETAFELLNVLADRRPAGGDGFGLDEDLVLIEEMTAAAEGHDLEILWSMPGHDGGFRVFAHRATFGDLFDLPEIARVVGEARSFALSGPSAVAPDRLDDFDSVATSESLLALAGERILRGAYHDEDRRQRLPKIANTLSLGFPPEAHLATVLGWSYGPACKPNVLPKIR